MDSTKTIVIVGGGFAGTTLARALDGKLPRGYELLLLSDPHAALRALAEGLKVSEMSRVETDAHLLAVLSVVQRRIGGEGKALKTAQKALERSLPRSPARVIALLSLGRRQEAEAEREAGELTLDIQPFLNLTPE